MKLGVNLAVFNNRNFEEALDRVTELGLDAVELNTEANDSLTPVDKLLDPKFLTSVRNAVESRGLVISGLGNHGESQLIGGPHLSDTDRFYKGTAAEKIAYGTKRLIETARIASELEVKTVIGFVGCQDWSRWFPWPDPAGWERMLPEFVETWTPILDEMKQLGVRFAHEPHPKQLVYDLETAIKVTDALDNRSEWGFNLDVANISLIGVNPAVFVQQLPDRIFHVHAKDFEIVKHNVMRSGVLAHGAWDRIDRGSRFRIPGWGDINWKCFLSELQLAGYEGVVSIEHEDPVFNRDEGIDQAVAFLKPLMFKSRREPAWW